MASHKKQNKKQKDYNARQARQLQDIKNNLRKNAKGERHLTLAEQLQAILNVYDSVVIRYGDNSKIAQDLLAFASSYQRTIEAQRQAEEAKAKAKA